MAPEVIKTQMGRSFHLNGMLLLWIDILQNAPTPFSPRSLYFMEPQSKEKDAKLEIQLNEMYSYGSVIRKKKTISAIIMITILILFSWNYYRPQWKRLFRLCIYMNSSSVPLLPSSLSHHNSIKKVVCCCHPSGFVFCVPSNPWKAVISPSLLVTGNAELGR